jgi:HSP20 family protein
MNIVNWTPFHEMDDFFNRFRPRSAALGENGDADFSGPMAWRPSADISESKKDYVIKADLPEVERDDVHVSVDGRSVTISGDRKMDKEEKDSKQHRIESFYGAFSRSFALPDNADVSNITAKSKNGVLKIRIPKIKESPESKIEIDVQ